jgi:hypothetical protein
MAMKAAHCIMMLELYTTLHQACDSHTTQLHRAANHTSNMVALYIRLQQVQHCVAVKLLRCWYFTLSLAKKSVVTAAQSSETLL